MTQETGILRTKLYRPQVAEKLVHRPRLLERLSRQRQRPLTLVCAPAGYGKTTLVSGWLESLDWPSAWLSLDEADRDLGLFLTYFLAALQTIFPEAGQVTLGLLKTATLPPVSVLSRSLINELEQLDTPFVLVLDDYHLIRESAVHDLLAELLRHPPRFLHLVLATRIDPPLNLPRLRVRNQVTEIRTHALRFSVAETATFLEQELGSLPDEMAVTTLAKQSEGWVASLRLMVLSLRNRGALSLSERQFSGQVAYIRDYLLVEVLEQLSPAIQEFLLKSSILDRICGPLSEAVTGLDDLECNGQAYLEWLHRSNLFTIPLDDRREWYRYHHLFQELLQRQLGQKRNAEEIAVLHRRASAWCAQNDLLDEALHYALAAGDTGGAVQLVAQHRHELMNQEQWHRLRRWLNLLPRDAVENDPGLLLVEAWLLIGWAEMMDVMVRIAPLLTKLPRESTETRKMQGEFNTLRSLISYHITDGEQALSLAQQALEELPSELASERGLAVMLKSLAYQMIGDLESARSVVFEALQEKATHAPTFGARVMMTSCFLDYIAADLKSALQSAKQVLKLGQELCLAETIAHGYYFLGLSHYERNDLVTAENCLLPAVKGDYIANDHNYAFSSFALALTYQAQDRPEEAREVVETVVNRATEISNSSLLQTAQAFQAQLALCQGDVAKANAWANTFNPDPFHVAYRFYVPQLTLPKWLLALATPASHQQAASFLSQLYDFFTTTHNTRLLIEVLALQALLADAQSDEAAALDKLEQTVQLAEPGGFIRLFVDLGPKMAGLLTRLHSQGVAPDYIAQILVAFPSDLRFTTYDLRLEERKIVNTQEALRRQSSIQNLIEPLTDRELEVLALLARRQTYKEIATQLVISPGTVRQHVHNIYQKLEVKRRKHAVAKAINLGILSSDKVAIDPL